MSPNFTDAVAQAIQTAFNEAQQRKNTEVTENHLLYAFLEDPQDLFTSVLTSLQGNISKLLTEVQQALDKLPTFSTDSSQAPVPSRNFQKPDRNRPRHSQTME